MDHRFVVTLSAALWVVVVAQACGDNSEPTEADPQSTPLTYWKDVAPLMADHCLQCHRQGGIAPVSFTDYADVVPFAQLIARVTRERTMPPWSATSDGTCGEFRDSIALSDDQIRVLSDWVGSGAPEGERTEITVPDVPTLSDATEFRTPDFTPEIQAGELTSSDEYRCFAIDVPGGPTQFITAYDVVPGHPEIIHHVIAMVVDPNAPADIAEDPTRTNLEQMRRLDDESPDRDGWPCYGMAGDGLNVEFDAVVWAPGQGVVHFPNDSGVPLPGGHKLVIQVHYNLADPRTLGIRDQTSVRLHLEPQVENVGFTALSDPFLESLDDGALQTLPPGKPSTVFEWTRTGAELGLPPGQTLELAGVMPHMHQLGRKYRMTITDADQAAVCGVDVANWDFHWQRMYFYAQSRTIGSDTSLHVSCDYDTSSVTARVEPGWGTRDEMCLASLYFTTPLPKE
jgi:hypothetical protein